MALAKAFSIDDGENLKNDEEINQYINDLEQHMYGYTFNKW